MFERIVRLLGLGRSNVQKLFDEADALLQQDRAAEALPLLERALVLRPNHAEAHFKLGNARKALNQPDEALLSYERALQIRPEYPQALNNAGTILQMQARFEAALGFYERAAACKPSTPEAFINLGYAYQMLGGNDRAMACYSAGLQAFPDSAVLRHMLDAAAGTTTARAPDDYVRSHFDDFACIFDRLLLQDLNYRIPEVLSLALRDIPAVPHSGLVILDLGCGTGLCGVAMRDIAAHLTGIDLSPRMLAKARERGVYDELVETDISAYLEQCAAEQFDLILAADVFIYIGDVAGILEQSARVLRHGGALAFSIETNPRPDSDYALEPSGRYSQSSGYIRRLAAQYGYAELKCLEQTIRLESGKPVAGQVYVLGKAADMDSLVKLS